MTSFLRTPIIGERCVAFHVRSWHVIIEAVLITVFTYVWIRLFKVDLGVAGRMAPIGVKGKNCRMIVAKEGCIRIVV